MTQKIKDRATRIPLKSGCELRKVAVPAPHVTPVVVMVNDSNIIRHGNRDETVLTV